jgi:Uma2 family endonuclease
MLLAFALDEWARSGDYGRVGTEWRFRIAPPGEIVRPLVPDVAYLSYDDLPRDAPTTDLDVPLGSPTVTVEVLSPEDRPRNVAHKIETYLAAGCRAVWVVDPLATTIAVHDGGGVRVWHEREVLSHRALPGFSLDIAALFERARA